MIEQVTQSAYHQRRSGASRDAACRTAQASSSAAWRRRAAPRLQRPLASPEASPGAEEPHITMSKRRHVAAKEGMRGAGCCVRAIVAQACGQLQLQGNACCCCKDFRSETMRWDQRSVHTTRAKNQAHTSCFQALENMLSRAQVRSGGGEREEQKRGRRYTQQPFKCWSAFRKHRHALKTLVHLRSARRHTSAALC